MIEDDWRSVFIQDGSSHGGSLTSNHKQATTTQPHKHGQTQRGRMFPNSAAAHDDHKSMETPLVQATSRAAFHREARPAAVARPHPPTISNLTQTGPCKPLSLHAVRQGRQGAWKTQVANGAASRTIRGVYFLFAARRIPAAPCYWRGATRQGCGHVQLQCRGWVLDSRADGDGGWRLALGSRSSKGGVLAISAVCRAVDWTRGLHDGGRRTADGGLVVRVKIAAGLVWFEARPQIGRD